MVEMNPDGTFKQAPTKITPTDWWRDEEVCQNCNEVSLIKLEFNDASRTTWCPRCGNTETYEKADWKRLKIQIYLASNYLTGNYFFPSQPVENLFRTYMRSLSHEDWCNCLIHDYVLARMRQDTTSREKLKAAANLVVEKMSYDSKPWNKLFEKLDASNPDVFLQVPETAFSMVKKKVLEAGLQDEEIREVIVDYEKDVEGMYYYYRWKGDRAAMWVARELKRICNEEYPATAEHIFVDNSYLDPFLKGFEEDALATRRGKNSSAEIQETYVQWCLKLAAKYLQDENFDAATYHAFEALTVKLGLQPMYPTWLEFTDCDDDIAAVAELVKDGELSELYGKAHETTLTTYDAPWDSAAVAKCKKEAAAKCTRLFIDKIEAILDRVKPLAYAIPNTYLNETTKSLTAYVS